MFKSPRLIQNSHPEKELNVSADKTLTRDPSNSDECNIDSKDSEDHIKTIPCSLPALRMNAVIPQYDSEKSKRNHTVL